MPGPTYECQQCHKYFPRVDVRSLRGEPGWTCHDCREKGPEAEKPPEPGDPLYCGPGVKPDDMTWAEVRAQQERAVLQSFTPGSVQEGDPMMPDDMSKVWPEKPPNPLDTIRKAECCSTCANNAHSYGIDCIVCRLMEGIASPFVDECLIAGQICALFDSREP